MINLSASLIVNKYSPCVSISLFFGLLMQIPAWQCHRSVSKPQLHSTGGLIYVSHRGQSKE